MARTKSRLTPLLPERHSEPDLFICDIIDAAPKGDRASMEHPLFSLSVKKDMNTFVYERNNARLLIAPSHEEGRANIFDRDILIYIVSQLMAAKKEGRSISRRVRVNAYDMLKSTNRFTSGQSYEALKRALTRLQFTKIETNIHDSGIGETRFIQFVTDSLIVKEDETRRMLAVEVELGAWLIDAIESNNVLTLNRDYFRLRRPLERRIYELARKHCGHKESWKISLAALKEKCGSQSTDKEFKRLVKGICEMDIKEKHIPDYDVRLVEPDFVEFYQKASMKALTQPTLDQNIYLSTKAFEEARRIAPGYDVYQLERDWREGRARDPKRSAEPLKSPDGAFLGYCKWRVSQDRREQAGLF